MWHNLGLGVKNRFLFILPLNMKTLVKHLPEGPNLLSSDVCVCVCVLHPTLLCCCEAAVFGSLRQNSSVGQT